MAKVGRPPLVYTEAQADEICNLVSAGSNLHVISKLPDFPGRMTIEKWMDEHAEFAAKYARARSNRADWRAARIDGIVARLLDADIDPGAARVAIDAEKWQASHEKPKSYGDKQTVEHSGIDGAAIAVSVDVKFGK